MKDTEKGQKYIIIIIIIWLTDCLTIDYSLHITTQQNIKYSE